MPRKELEEKKKKKSKNGKPSKERLSVHFCCHATNENLKTLVTSNVAPVHSENNG
jgi:hypothetical protein